MCIVNVLSMPVPAGLYWVEKYWLCPGQAGFLVYKYAMRRCEDQPPPPWKVRRAAAVSDCLVSSRQTSFRVFFHWGVQDWAVGE